MDEARKAYARAILHGVGEDGLTQFIADAEVAKRFSALERVLRNDWQRFNGDLSKPSVKKFEMPVFGESAAPALPATTPEASATSAAALAVSMPAPPVPAADPAPICASVSEQSMSPPIAPTNQPQSVAGGASAPAPGNPLPAKLRELPVPAFKLRNARQSEMYSEALAWEPASALVRLVDVLMPPDLGLQFDLVTGRAEGTPHRSGEFSIPLHYRYADDPPEARRPAVLRLYVNADPKLLWKNLPSDTADPFWKPDEAEQTLVGPLRRVVAARKRGRSHAHVGSCCDDDFLIHHDIDGDWYVGIVADGAGSAQFSRRGSQLAVRAAGAHVKQALAGEAGEKVAAAVLAVQEAASDEAASHARRVLQNALYVVVGHAAYMAMRALVDEAQACSDRISAVKELATTLLIGVARKFGTQWLCAAYWVGDGAVGVYRRDQSVELLGEVDAGEYSGQTRFLDKNEVTQEALNKRTRFTLCDDFTAFVLMTDGVSDPKFETEARLANLDAWNALWEDLEANAGLAGAAQGQKLLDWLDFWSQGNHDDRTIAIIY